MKLGNISYGNVSTGRGAGAEIAASNFRATQTILGAVKGLADSVAEDMIEVEQIKANTAHRERVSKLQADAIKSPTLSQQELDAYGILEDVEAASAGETLDEDVPQHLWLPILMKRGMDESAEMAADSITLRGPRKEWTNSVNQANAEQMERLMLASAKEAKQYKQDQAMATLMEASAAGNWQGARDILTTMDVAPDERQQLLQEIKTKEATGNISEMRASMDAIEMTDFGAYLKTPEAAEQFEGALTSEELIKLGDQTLSMSKTIEAQEKRARADLQTSLQNDHYQNYKNDPAGMLLNMPDDLDFEKQKALESYAHQQGQRGYIVTNPTVYTDLVSEMELNPEAYIASGRSVVNHMNELSRADFDRLAAMESSLRKKPSQPTRLTTYTTRRNAIYTQMGINPKTKSGAEQAWRVDTYLQDMIAEERDRLGTSKLNDQQMNAVFMEASRQIATGAKTFWGNKVMSSVLEVAADATDEELLLARDKLRKAEKPENAQTLAAAVHLIRVEASKGKE